MQVEREGNNKKARFYIQIDNKKAAVLEYVYAGADKIILEHTGVDDQYAGQGLGKALVLEAVEYARRNGQKIIPLCPFAKAEFIKNNEYRDVWYGLHHHS